MNYSVIAGDNSTSLPAHHFTNKRAALAFAFERRGELSCNSSSFVTVYIFEDGDDQGHTSRTIRTWKGNTNGKWFSAAL